MEQTKRTNDDYFKIACDSLTTREWTVTELSKERVKELRFGCYVCDKRNEKLYEVVCEGGEPFWFGTSCAKRLKQATGIDLAKAVKQQ